MSGQNLLGHLGIHSPHNRRIIRHYVTNIDDQLRNSADENWRGGATDRDPGRFQQHQRHWPFCDRGVGKRKLHAVSSPCRFSLQQKARESHEMRHFTYIPKMIRSANMNRPRLAGLPRNAARAERLHGKKESSFPITLTWKSHFFVSFGRPRPRFSRAIRHRAARQDAATGSDRRAPGQNFRDWRKTRPARGMRGPVRD